MTLVRTEHLQSWGHSPFARLWLYDRDKQFDGHALTHPSLEEARKALRAAMTNRRTELLHQIENIDQNLENLDTLFAPPATSVAASVREHFAQVVATVSALRRVPGQTTVGLLHISNVYCNAGPELFVLTLPSDGAVVETFGEDVLALVRSAFTQAGAAVSEEYNGEGFTSWSLRTGCPDEENENAPAVAEAS